MKTASITEAKNNLSALIDGLKGGSPVLIVDRGRPVALLEAVTGDYRREHADRLLSLVRSGLVRARRNAPPREVLNTRPPSIRAGASVIGALIEERREGR
jgi:antitoxin (DNA-binding transcriptional repressor) of toxin-antitoxin stability system